MDCHVVIVGAGPAGVAGAVQCTRLGLTVMLIDRTGLAGGLISNGCSIENYPGLEAPVSGEEFALRLRRQLERFHIPVHGETVRRITPNISENGATGTWAGWSVHTDGRTIYCEAVITACGTTPRMISFPGRDSIEAQNAIFYEVKPLLERFTAPSVVIVGGGEASFDYALSIARAGGDVTLLCRSPRPNVHGRLQTLVQRETAISIFTDSEIIRARVQPRTPHPVVVEISKNAKKSDCCTTLAKKRCDAILIAVGRTSLVHTLLAPEFCIPNCLTPAEGLFICGDAGLGTLGQAGIAVGDGLLAAQTIFKNIGRTR